MSKNAVNIWICRVTKTKKKLKPEKPENTKLSKKVKHTDEQKEKNLKKSIKNGYKSISIHLPVISDVSRN